MASDVLAILGLGFQALGLVLHVIGLATPGWSVDRIPAPDNYYGLWEKCRDSSCTNHDYTFRKDSDGEVEAAQAFSIIAMLIGALAVACACFVILMPISSHGHRIAPFHIVSAILAVFAALSVLIVVVIWGAGVHDELDDISDDVDLTYAFGLSVAGGVFFLPGALFILLGGRRTHL